MNQRLIDKLMEHARKTAQEFNTKSANRYGNMIRSQAYQTLEPQIWSTKKKSHSLREAQDCNAESIDSN